MDHLETLKEWLEYYKGRYEKAVSLNITEGSRHYPAFKEIEKSDFEFYKKLEKIIDELIIY